MNLSTIELPQAEAEDRWREYAEAIKHAHSDEDAALAAGYKALSEGKRLISLSDVMRDAGCGEGNLPRLAVAKVRSTWCWVNRRTNGSCQFRSVEEAWRTAKSNSVTLPADTFDRCEYSDVRRSFHGLRAMTPIVPPRHRPKRARLMHDYHVLWEATWEEAPRPPGDPALIRHLRGDLWLLLATWDLTDLERAVLSERAL